jgi:hypothetical protein
VLPLALLFIPIPDPPDQTHCCADLVTLPDSRTTTLASQYKLKLPTGQVLHALAGRVSTLLCLALPPPNLLGNQSAPELLAMGTLGLVLHRSDAPACILKELPRARLELRWTVTRHGWKTRQETSPIRGQQRLNQCSRHRGRIKQA